MKEKSLMTWFSAGSYADVGITAMGLNIGLKEVGVVAAPLVESGRFDYASMLRIGTTAVMVGLYALSKEKNSRFAFSFEKSIQVSNIIAWGINVMNAAQIIYGQLPKS